MVVGSNVVYALKLDGCGRNASFSGYAHLQSKFLSIFEHVPNFHELVLALNS